MRGYVEQVSGDSQGTSLAADASVGDTSIAVVAGEQFAADGSSAVLAGGTYLVVAIDSGEWEDDPDVLHLAAALTAEAEAGDPVQVTPGTDYTTATVILADDGKVLEGVAVRQDLQSKIVLQPGTSYDIDERPIVDVELVDGQHVITNVDGRGADDGSYIDPDTLPEVPTTDGLPPAESPVLTVIAGPGYALVRYPAIENADPVTAVRIHVSATEPVDLGVYATTGANGDSVMVRTTSEGARLEPGVDYVFVAVAEDADGKAPAGPPAGGRVASVSLDEVGDDVVQAIDDAANSLVTDGRLVAGSLMTWPFADGRVPPGALAAGAVRSGDIADFAIAAKKLNLPRHIII